MTKIDKKLLQGFLKDYSAFITALEDAGIITNEEEEETDENSN